MVPGTGAPESSGMARRFRAATRSLNAARRAFARLAHVDRCSAGRRLGGVVSSPAPEHQARGQKSDTTEQDRDGGKAGERELVASAALGAGLDLARGLRGAATALGRGRAAAGLFLAEDALIALIVLLALDPAVLALGRIALLAGEAADGEGAAAGAQQPAEDEHGDDRQS